jgi:hypothetical protein
MNMRFSSHTPERLRAARELCFLTGVEETSTYCVGKDMSSLEVTMFCPTCRAEYREGIVDCPTCHEPLTPELPPQPAVPAVQWLPTAATTAMIGTVVIFLLRTIGTFYISPSLIVARAVSAIFCLSYIAIIIFFLVLLKEVVLKSQLLMKFGTWTALAGCIVAAAIVALNLLALFEQPVVSGRQLMVASNITSMLIPVTSVIFFAAFWADSSSTSAQLTTAVKLALIGAILSAAAHGVASAYTGLSSDTLSDVQIIPLVAGAPIIVFAVGTWLYFLWVIRYSQPARLELEARPDSRFVARIVIWRQIRKPKT